MSILQLPYELLLTIANDLKSKDWNALLQSNSRLYKMLNEDLYHHNVHHENASALSWAASSGNMSTLERLLNNGADIQWCCSYELFDAECQENEKLRLLQDSDIIRNSHPISAAASNGHIEIVHKLLDLGVMVQERDLLGRCLLSLAAREGHFLLVQQLIHRGACLLSIDVNGMRPVDHAAKQGHHEIEEYLFQKLCDLPYLKRPSRSLTLQRNLYWMLRSAAERGDESQVRHLATREGVDVNYQPTGGTILIAALNSAPRPVSMAKILLDEGADPSLGSLPFTYKWTMGCYQRVRSPYRESPVEAALRRDDSYSLLGLLFEYGGPSALYPDDSLIKAANLKKVQEFVFILDNTLMRDSTEEILAGLAAFSDCQPIVKSILARGIVPQPPRGFE